MSSVEFYSIARPPSSPLTRSPLPTSPDRSYAFLSSPPQSRQMASYSVPPSPGRKLKLLSPRKRAERAQSAQANEIRPATDWNFLMSGPLGGGQKHVVQRPWPEYVPESSAPVGRTWTTCTRARKPPPARRPRAASHAAPRSTARSIARTAPRRTQRRTQHATPHATPHAAGDTARAAARTAARSTAHSIVRVARASSTARVGASRAPARDARAHRSRPVQLTRGAQTAAA